MHRYFDIFNNAFRTYLVDDYIEVDEYAMIFSTITKDPIWNAANKLKIEENDTAEAIIDIELLFANHKTNPCFWVSSADHPRFIDAVLKDKGYAFTGTCNWMIHKTVQNYQITGDTSPLFIKPLETEQDAIDFITVYSRVHADPQGIFKEFFMKKVMDRTFKLTNRLFIGYENGVPVVLTGYVMYEKTAVAHSLTVITDREESNYGTIMAAYALHNCPSEQMLALPWLQSKEETLYKAIGFEDLMHVKLFTKNW